MEPTLAERGPWLLGKSPTLADINLMPFVARLAYLGLLEAWTATARASTNGGRGRRNGRASGAGLHDLISEAEFAEMRTHGPKIRADVEALIARVAGATVTVLRPRGFISRATDSSGV